MSGGTTAYVPLRINYCFRSGHHWICHERTLRHSKCLIIIETRSRGIGMTKVCLIGIVVFLDIPHITNIRCVSHLSADMIYRSTWISPSSTTSSSATLIWRKSSLWISVGIWGGILIWIWLTFVLSHIHIRRLISASGRQGQGTYPWF